MQEKEKPRTSEPQEVWAPLEPRHDLPALRVLSRGIQTLAAEHWGGGGAEVSESL